MSIQRLMFNVLKSSYYVCMTIDQNIHLNVGILIINKNVSSVCTYIYRPTKNFTIFLNGIF